MGQHGMSRKSLSGARRCQLATGPTAIPKRLCFEPYLTVRSAPLSYNWFWVLHRAGEGIPCAPLSSAKIAGSNTVVRTNEPNPAVQAAQGRCAVSSVPGIGESRVRKVRRIS